MKLQIVKGSTSQIVTVFIQDSSSTTGAGLGSLDQTSSIVGGFVRTGSTGIALAVDENVATEGTYQAPSAAGKVRIGTPANMRTGTYELHFHDDIFADGASSVFITLGGASDMADLPIEIQLIVEPASADQVNNIGSGATGGTHVEATYDNTTRDTIDNAGADLKGGGLVGIPVTGHTFVAGREITIAGSVAYNGAFDIVSQTANEVVITHAQTAEAFGGAETIVSSIKGQIFVGTVTSGTFASVSKENGVLHSMDDVGDNIDIVYGFNIGGSRQATAAGLFTNVNGNTDQMVLSAYNFADSQWEPDGNGILLGSGGSSFTPLNPELVSRNTGVGVEIGDVLLRLHKVTTTPSSLDVDKCLLTAVGTNTLIGYPNGFEVSAAGTSGTEFTVNGTSGNPCPFDDAVTMNNVNPLNQFAIHNGEEVTLQGASDGISLIGEGWTLILNEKSISASYFHGADVSGVGTGASPPHFHCCHLGTVSLPPCHITDCGFEDVLTLTGAGDYFLDSCHAAALLPAIDFEDAAENKNLYLSGYHGDVEVRNIGQAGSTDTMHLEGWGTLVLASTCEAATIEIQGHFPIVDNVGGGGFVDGAGGTINDEARFDLAQIRVAALAYAGPRGPGVYLNDAASNTNTANGVDGTWSNPVSTIAAAKTIADSLGFKRLYLVNNSSVTLTATMEDYEIIAIGEMTANVVDFGTQDTDRSVFYNLLLTGTQGGTGRCQAEGCCLSVIAGMEITALGCLLADAGSLTLRNDCAFDRWWSAVAGGGSPKLNINSVANVNAYMRHGSGGIQIDNAVATTIMSVETDGQVIVGATSTSLEIHVRGNCSITDNGTTTNLTQDAAINLTNINAECDTALSDYGALKPTTADRTLDVNATGEAGLDLDNTSGTINAAQLGADCITSDKIADDAISSEHINTGALTADAFAADALVAATFATGAFTADAFAADALVAATFATGAFTADAFAADALVAATFATGAFTADAFAANALVAATFAASSLDGKGDWNTVVPDAAGVAPTVAEIQAEMEEDGASILDTLRDQLNGITSLPEWLGAMAGDQAADATALSEIRATGAGSGEYDEATDSLEAIAGAGGGSAPTVEQIRTEMDDNSTELAKIGVIPALDGASQTIGAAIGKLADDNAGASYDAEFDSLNAITGADGDTLETLSDQIDTLSALSGEGAFTGTLTIDDGSTGLEGAVVNARRGGVLKASGTTDASGEITNWVFGNFTYDLAVRLGGYEPETDTITVSADGWTKTISLTANFISPPPSATTTTGVMTVYDEEGSVEEGVTITVQIIEGEGTNGIGYDSTDWAKTSDVNGIVQFAGIHHGARYKIWRGTSKADVQTFAAPTSGTSFDLAEVIGRG